MRNFYPLRPPPPLWHRHTHLFNYSKRSLNYSKRSAAENAQLQQTLLNYSKRSIIVMLNYSKLSAAAKAQMQQMFNYSKRLIKFKQYLIYQISFKLN